MGDEATFDFNPLSPSFRRDPHSFLRDARGRVGHVVAHRAAPILSAVSHDAVVWLLRHHDTWSSAFRPPPGAAERDFSPMLLTHDRPEHDRLRSLVNKAFTPRRIRAMEPEIRDLARRLVQAFPTETFEFNASFSVPLTVSTISRILGLGDVGQKLTPIARIAEKTFGASLFMPPGEDVIAVVSKAKSVLYRHFDKLVEARRTTPNDDLVSALISAEEGGQALTRAEVVHLLVSLFELGFPTTSMFLSNFVQHCLLSRPHLRDELLANSTSIDGAIEEVMRRYPSVIVIPRVARADCELLGQRARAGQLALAWTISAMSDEAVVERPEEFDIHRSTRPNLAFGHGLHYCLGAPLARLIARIAVEELLAVKFSLEADPAALKPHPSPVTVAVWELPVRIA